MTYRFTEKFMYLLLIVNLISGFILYCFKIKNRCCTIKFCRVFDERASKKNVKNTGMKIKGYLIAPDSTHIMLDVIEPLFYHVL